MGARSTIEVPRDQAVSCTGQADDGIVGWTVRDFVASHRYQATRPAASQNNGRCLMGTGFTRKGAGRWCVPYCSCSHTVHA